MYWMRQEKKLDLCVWCGEKTIAGNILTSWPEKIELLGKNTGNTQEYFEDYFFHLGWYGLICGSGKVAIKNMDKALIFHKEDLSKKDDIADLILACILYGDKKKGADYAQALKACMEREDKSGKDVYLKYPKLRIVHEYLAGYYTATDEEQDTPCNWTKTVPSAMAVYIPPARNWRWYGYCRC